MVTHLARYQDASDIRWGVVVDGGLAPLTETYATTADLIRDGQADCDRGARRRRCAGIG